jgi:hypothetical protein
LFAEIHGRSLSHWGYTVCADTAFGRVRRYMPQFAFNLRVGFRVGYMRA